MIPIITLGMVVMDGADEPSETAMRAAFAAKLAAQVQGALDYVAETGGAAALDRVRAAGTDRFEIRSFIKRDCSRSGEIGHVCGFAVEVGTVGGPLQHSLRGRFYFGPRGLVFAGEA
jgi:hypothetical protein